MSADREGWRVLQGRLRPLKASGHRLETGKVRDFEMLNPGRANQINEIGCGDIVLLQNRTRVGLPRKEAPRSTHAGANFWIGSRFGWALYERRFAQCRANDPGRHVKAVILRVPSCGHNLQSAPNQSP